MDFELLEKDSFQIEVDPEVENFYANDKNQNSSEMNDIKEETEVSDATIPQEDMEERGKNSQVREP